MKLSQKVFITTITLAVSGFVGLVIQHEGAHVQIFRQHGVNSFVEYGFLLLNAKTIPTSECLYNCNSMITEHVFNDVIGYHAKMFLIVFIFLFGLIASLFAEHFEQATERGSLKK